MVTEPSITLDHLYTQIRKTLGLEALNGTNGKVWTDKVWAVCRDLDSATTLEQTPRKELFLLLL